MTPSPLAIPCRRTHNGRLSWSFAFFCSLLFFASISGPAKAQLNNETSPTHIFRSRPDLHAPIINMKILRPELVSPGYIFIAPYRNRDPGPYIYDNYGELIWSGAGESGPRVTHAPHTCQYKSKPHLCFFQGEQHQGFARGHGTILDQHYRVVKTIDSSGAGASSDMHEFRMAPHSNGTTVLMTIYQPRMYDLTMNPTFRIRGGMGWIVEGVFQEVEIETGRTVFEWRSTDHFDPSLSYTFPASTDTSGDGLSEDTPWDYFHINSIDKNPDGDYLISARHTAGIYKLSGRDGHVMWQLGGANPSFNQTNFRFSSQHHARWLSENGTHTVLSLFDNASNGFNKTDFESRGYLISIDHIANTATAVRRWSAPPEAGILSGSQGNLQLLPGGNVHLGWGEHAYFSEHTWDGDPVQFGVLALRPSNVMVYRSYKFNWTGTPITKPALWTYARTDQSAKGMSFYTSWNGATEVASWNFYVSNSSAGPFQLAGTTWRRGFETQFRHAMIWDWAFSEAIDSDGRPLERSQVSKTFIPSPQLAPFCDDSGCTRAHYVEDADYNAEEAHAFVVDWETQSPNRGFDTADYYAHLGGTMQALASHKIELGSLILGLVLALPMFAAGWFAYRFVQSHLVSAPRSPLVRTTFRKLPAGMKQILIASPMTASWGDYISLSGKTEKDDTEDEGDHA